MRLSSVHIITGISCIFFASAGWRVVSHSSSDFTAQAQTAKTTAATAAQLHAASASIPVSTKPAPVLLAAPGTEIYTAKRGEAIPTIARRYLGRTSYLTSSELAGAIRHSNGDRTANILKANENILIPGILSAPVTEKTIPVPKDFEVRAIYLTGIMAASDHGLRIVRHWREVGGNAVVFDIKDSDGSVTIPFEHPLLGQHQVYIHDVPKLVRFLHQQNMHAIARIAIFRDERLVKEHPELAVQSRRDHQAWRENGKLVWTDPSQPKVQDYNIALAKHVAELGADEIQFDYVRFPAEGEQKDAAFAYQLANPEAAQAAQDSSANGSCGEGLGHPAEAKQSGTSGPTDGVTGSAKTSPEGAASDSSGPKSRGADKKGNKSRRRGTSSAETKSACLAPRGPQRSDVITAFLKKAYAELHPTGVLLSLDVFGVMAWQRQVDLSHTGQDIVGMAHYADVLSPMIYGYANYSGRSVSTTSSPSSTSPMMKRRRRPCSGWGLSAASARIRCGPSAPTRSPPSSGRQARRGSVTSQVPAADSRRSMAALRPPGLARGLESEALPACRRSRGTQASMIHRYIIRRSNHADDERLRYITDQANVT